MHINRRTLMFRFVFSNGIVLPITDLVDADKNKTKRHYQWYVVFKIKMMFFHYYKKNVPVVNKTRL